LRGRFGLAVWVPSAPLTVSAGAWARSGELTGRLGVFLLRFGLAAPLGGGNRTINGGDSGSTGSLGGTGLCLGGARRSTAAAE
jgi:hypothetical protein